MAGGFKGLLDFVGYSVGAEPAVAAAEPQPIGPLLTMRGTEIGGLSFPERKQIVGPIQGSLPIKSGSLEIQAASPAQITGDQNNYNPSPAGFWRLSSDASRTITGIAGVYDGRVLNIVNVGSQNIVLANQHVGSFAVNRIITGTGANITLAADDTAMLVYDAVTLRWRVTNTH